MCVCVLVLLQPLPGEQAGGGALHCQPHGSGENYRHLRQVRALTTVSTCLFLQIKELLFLHDLFFPLETV